MYKNVYGDKLVFEEINQDLKLTFRYAWRTSGRYGFVKSSWLKSDDTVPCQVEVLDGLQNLLPYGVISLTQNTFSVLLDAYKPSEGSLAYTFCQVSVVYISSPANKIGITYSDGRWLEVQGNRLNAENFANELRNFAIFPFTFSHNSCSFGKETV